MKFIDMFAGLGGFRLGMEMAGHTCVGFCEFDKFAVASYTSMHLITDEQREYLSTLKLKDRQKEILKDVYKNGEWYANDIRAVTGDTIPKADCWCFGAPCQDFSIAGKRAGLDGDRSSLVGEVFRILREIKEEDRPEWLIYENVKGMFSSNRGFDYFQILSEMDEGGYDIQWQLLNSEYHGVPQSRERVYTIGHLRRYGRREILPIEAHSGETTELQGQQSVISNTIHARVSSVTRGCYPIDGGAAPSQRISQVSVNAGYREGISETETANTLMARDYKGISNRSMTTVYEEYETNQDS